MKVKVINVSNNPLPEYATKYSAGCDVRANILEDILIHPGERVLIPTGLHCAIPIGYEIMVRPRSGLALKHGITVLNTPGCIDADFRGEIGVILINHSHKAFKIEPGDRIGQLILNKVEQIEWEEVDKLDTTDRGSNGYNSTGIK